jgi:hypothetical protein
MFEATAARPLPALSANQRTDIEASLGNVGRLDLVVA